MKKRFFCIDGHTCGNPVRLVAGGGPVLSAPDIAGKRMEFMKDHDWIRTGLMFEPRGHDMMSGSILYPPSDPGNDVAILFIETSGCLPMCGHGTIGTVTMALEEGLIEPQTPGIVRIETPAGPVQANYVRDGDKVASVRISNVDSFLYEKDIRINVPNLGELTLDIAYGGNFYAIIDPQENFPGLDKVTAGDLIRWSPMVRKLLNQYLDCVHPLDDRIRGLSHVMWTGQVLDTASTGRNAVFYGEKAIDRSPCGTGTSARMAQWYARGRLWEGVPFVHESIIGSVFTGRIESVGKTGPFTSVQPSIEGWARLTGYNTITIDPEDDPFAYGFQVI